MYSIIYTLKCPFDCICEKLSNMESNTTLQLWVRFPLPRL